MMLRLALTFEHGLVLLIGGAFVLIRWIVSRASGPDESDTLSTPTSRGRADATTEEERMRRFLEALGQPAGTKPPSRRTIQPVLRRPEIPVAKTAPSPPRRPRRLLPKPAWGNPLPALLTRPELVPPRSDRATPTRLADTPPRPEVPVIRPVAVVAKVIAPAPVATGTIEELLRSPDGLRKAVMLREIFGSPRGLRPMVGVGDRPLGEG